MATLDPPQVLDTTRAYRIYLESDQVGGSLAGLYTGSETLSGRIWSGEDQATVVTPTVVWDTDVADNPDGVDKPVLLMTVPASALTSVAAGTYLWQITVDFATEKIAYPAEPGTITFIDGPGSATAPAVYGTLKQLKDVCPWIEQVQGFADTAGFADARGLAREWADAFLLERVPAPDRTWVRTALAANQLLTTGPEGKRIVRASSLYAAHLILMREPGREVGGSTYREMAEEMLNGDEGANALIRRGVAWIDSDGDGVGDYAIRPGLVRLERG
jgi:hypothetical protein